ncbi:MAG TPA: ankyrin repeat domain-containing protein [Azonexus sp.]
MALVWPAAAGAEPALPTPLAFVTAMELGDLERAGAWLDAGLPPDFMGSRIGSGLMIGAWEGKLDLMRLFISRGADINLANANGETALVLAAWRGNLEVVQWLIERGARLNPPTRQWAPLHYAVLAGHEPVVDYLLAQGADIDALSTNGSSALMLAVYEGRQGLAKKLLEKGADRTPKNDWGDGALEWAMRNNNLNIARMLTNPEEFNIAVSQPREKWGTPTRSLAMSEELKALLAMRETLAARQLSTASIDQRIATERARLVRGQLDRQTPAEQATLLEISASRQPGRAQSMRIVPDNGGRPAAAARAKGPAKKARNSR